MTPAMVYQLLLAVGAALGGSLFAYLTTRRFLMRAVMEEAATYKRLAQAKSAELEELAKRLDYLEQLAHTLENQNAELRELNLALQRENVEQKEEITRLRNRVEQLEAASSPSPKDVPPREPV